MFKTFVNTLMLGCLIASAVFILAHVQKVEGFQMVAQCSVHQCYEINNTVFVVK